ncbi:MAG: SgcJ/EcaC family oxidoreductase [Pyrinomonadaceae bacterium]
MKIKMLIMVALICFAATSGFAQTKELILSENVRPNRDIDAIYKTFSEGYKTLKPELVANLYTEDAAYLSPNQEIVYGREAILANFTAFFNSMKNGGQTMTISFEIFQRKVEEKIGYDVGIYTINFYKDGVKQGDSKGKFVVVAVEDNDGTWRFQVDGYSSLTPPRSN